MKYAAVSMGSPRRSKQSGNPRLTRAKQARFLKLVETYAISLAGFNTRKQQQAYTKALQYAQSVGLDFEEALPQAMSHLKKTRVGLSLRHGLDSFRNPRPYGGGSGAWGMPKESKHYYKVTRTDLGDPNKFPVNEYSGRNKAEALKKAKAAHKATGHPVEVFDTKAWVEIWKSPPSKGNPSERVSTGVSEAYATKKGSGTIQSPKKRGPYSVQFMARGGEAVTKNIARLPAARKWLRSKLGVLRKANPATIADAFSGQVMNPSGVFFGPFTVLAGPYGGKKVFTSKSMKRALARAKKEAVASEGYATVRDEYDGKTVFRVDLSGNLSWSAPGADLAYHSKRNPSGEQRSADTLFEEFHGKSPTRTVEVRTSVKVREHLAQLGVLVSLKVLLLTGEKIELTFPAEGRDAVTLASSPDGRQLYFEGGNQHIDLGDLEMASSKWERDSMVLGVLFQVTYQTTKGFDKFQLTDYYHDLGEETKIQPLLIYDRLSKLLTVSGGQYEVKPEGIVN